MVLPLFGLLAGAAMLGQGVVVPKLQEMKRKREAGIREGLLAGVDPNDPRAQSEALMRGGLLDPNDFLDSELGFGRLDEDRRQFGMNFDEGRRQFDSNDDFRRDGRNREIDAGASAALSSIPTEYMMPATPEQVTYAIDGLRNFESGGNYSALGPVTASGDRAYGAYQVMGAHIPEWTEKVLKRRMTPQEFLADRTAQDDVAMAVFGGYAQEGGLANAYSKWHSGVDLATAVKQGRRDVNMATEDYVLRNLGVVQGVAARNVETRDPIFREAQVRGEPWRALDPKVREEIIVGENALGTIEDTVDFLDDSTAADRILGDPGLAAQLQSEYQLTVLPELQKLFAAGAMQEGELQLFQKLAGSGFDWNQLTPREQSKMKGVVSIIGARLAAKKQSLGLTTFRPERNALPEGTVEGLPGVPEGGRDN